MMETWAIILARGGSKGLPHKNLRLLCGQPLVDYSLRAAVVLPGIARVILSSDDDEILARGVEYGAETHVRPTEFAGDTALSGETIQDILSGEAERVRQVRPRCILLQPTSPLRNAGHVQAALDLADAHPGATIISGYRPNVHPMKAYVESDDGTIRGAYSDEAPYQPRQQLPEAFMANGAIYIFDGEHVLDEASLVKDSIYPFIMSEYESLDIDSLQDLEEAERRMRDVDHEQ